MANTPLSSTDGQLARPFDFKGEIFSPATIDDEVALMRPTMKRKPSASR